MSLPQNNSENTALCEKIANFAAGFELASAPVHVVELVETAFLDTIGVMLAGSREPAAHIASATVRDDRAAPIASVVGSDFKTSPQNAALVNGVSTQALDFDLSFMSGQSTAALVPALLAVSEKTGATPKDLIAAYIVGAEVCARLAQSCPALSNDAGWHGAGVFGTTATAAALARLTGQSASLTTNIIAITTSLASSLGANFGTMTKPLHAGQAARNAILALSLGARGFTGNPDALEGRNGYFPAFARGLEVDTGCFDDLGERFYLDQPGYKIKPYACGGVLHCAIEATEALREEHGLAPHDIDHIVVGVTPHAANRALTKYPWSEDNARFSPLYLIPYTLIHGAPTLDTFTEEAIGDPAVQALSQCCETAVDDEFSHMTVSGNSPARITIFLNDGTRFEKCIRVPAGTRETPMSRERLEAKFMSCATRAISEKTATDLLQYLTTLGDQTALSNLWPLITAPTPTS